MIEPLDDITNVQMTHFYEELQELAKKYNVGSVLASASFMATPAGETTANPITHRTTEMSFIVVNDALKHGKGGVFDTSLTDINQAIDNAVSNFDVDDLVKEYLTISTFLRSLVCMVEKVQSIDPQQVQRAAKGISNKLGLDRSRLIAIKPSKKYIVITDDRNSYEVFYEADMVFMVRCMTKPDFIIPPLSFIGNVQDDGTIFNVSELPIFSTGDRLLFGNRGDVSKIMEPVFITTRVVNVILETNIQ